MKIIGLIGGMSWESSAEYYRMINEEVKRRLGGLHSAQCILYSVDFAEIELCQSEGNWVKAGEILAVAAKALENGGADFIVICTNTMHKVIDAIQRNINIPILHIADATATQIKKHGIKTIGLLGTKYTMEQDFYKARLESQGFNILIPDVLEREMINTIIYEELCLGKILPSSRSSFTRAISHLIENGAEGIILGCTEIGLLVKQEDCHVPLFDTTSIHAVATVKKAIE
ncbi:MAG: aspartate/glutamate racemase family protein [Bacillus sp. (in: firmicutes)]